MGGSRFTTYADDTTQRVMRTWQTVQAQPSWVARFTLMTFLLVVAVPVFLLLLLALIAATVVFAVLWAAARLLTAVRGVLPRRDGRENVRVIKRVE